MITPRSRPVFKGNNDASKRVTAHDIIYANLREHAWTVDLEILTDIRKKILSKFNEPMYVDLGKCYRMWFSRSTTELQAS